MIKKTISILLCLITVFAGFSVGIINGSCEGLSVSAKAAVLMCANNGKILFEKNADEKLPMASTTKIMTAILALEAAAADDTVVEFKQEMITEGSSMYLKVGDKVKLSGLVGGLMAASGNDAANAIALTVGKTSEGFAQMMNDRAKRIGMTSTHFVTPSGLDAEGHFSTARDMAVLMAYAVENEHFREIVGKQSIKVDFEEPENYSNTYRNHNRLLSMYEYCKGGKTGFTDEAGRCLVTYAEKDGIQLIAVTLNAPDDWNDHISMYNYGFKSLGICELDDTKLNITLPVVGGEEDSVTVTAKSTLSVVTDGGACDLIESSYELPHFVYADVLAGEPVGRIVYTLNGEYVGEVDLIAVKEIKYKKEDKNGFEKLIEKIYDLFWGRR